MQVMVRVVSKMEECPFCGKQAVRREVIGHVVREYTGQKTDRPIWALVCDACGYLAEEKSAEESPHGN